MKRFLLFGGTVCGGGMHDFAGSYTTMAGARKRCCRENWSWAHVLDTTTLLVLVLNVGAGEGDHGTYRMSDFGRWGLNAPEVSE